ncbi:hypothetical protein HMPREF9057_02844 [Actinomyces sp. oral taxon 171 str. F0337]|nr:hypothetical protein HMPREF9057_02844 [Actinomyces sp. oral taxon 171 str. F0337]
MLVLLARPTGDRYCFNRVQPRLSPWQPPHRDRRVVGSNDFLPYVPMTTATWRLPT